MPRGVPGSKAPHGTLTRYTKHGCRCEECQAARRAYESAKRGRSVQTLADYIASTTHHGYKRYQKGCRCEICRAASAAQKRRQRARHREHYRAYDRERKRAARAAA